jgi:hypothetical protein
MGAPIERDARSVEPAVLVLGKAISIVANTEIMNDMRMITPFGSPREHAAAVYAAEFD